MAEQGAPADASSLIYIAKCDAFGEIHRVVPSILVPASVWEESVEAGQRVSAPEVQRITDALDAGFLRRTGLSRIGRQHARTLAETHRLGRGESEVLTLARSPGTCIVDEGRASRIAVSMGITPVPTLLLPVAGHRWGVMTREEALDLVRRLAVVTGTRAEVVFAIEEELSGGRR